MFAINGPLDAVLLGCFLFGLVFAVVVLLAGDAGSEIDLFGGGEGSGEDGGLAINLSTVLVFVSWFGGVGFLAVNGAGWPVAVGLVVAAVVALAGAAAVAWVMAKLVARGAELDPEDYRLPGTLARVTSSIREGGVGEIVYEQAGVRQVSAARSAEGVALPQGVEVVILEQRRGTAVVQSAATFFEEAGLTVGPERGLRRPDESERRRLT